MAGGHELREVALLAARDGAAVHRERLGSVRAEDGDLKGIADYVTSVDREAEATVLGRIATSFPDHAVLAEESAAPEPDSSEWLWIVDPLDGTTNFLHGFPMFAASVAVAHRGTLVAGAVVSSATGEEWTAAAGLGATMNGQPIVVSTLASLRHALVGTGFPFKKPALLSEYLVQLEAVLRATAGVRRAGSAALDLCYLACGRLDAFWELDLAAWDVAAGTLIAREAGATVTRLDGSPDMIGSGSVLAGTPSLYGALARVLRTAGQNP